MEVSPAIYIRNFASELSMAMMTSSRGSDAALFYERRTHEAGL